MNYKKLNIFSNIYFIFLTLVGVVYSVFVFKLFIETAPGFVMLLIYFVDTLKHGYSLEKVDSLSLLLVTSSISLITQFLIYRLIRATLVVYKQVISTKEFTRNLKITSVTDNLVTIGNHSSKAFTSGLFHPRIHLPQKLNESLSKDEVRAIMLHETQHCKSYDPLKGVVVNFINKSIPGFPFKKWIFGYQNVLAELTADAYAESKLKKRLPIISALLKQHEENAVLAYSAVGFSSSQSERIHILVGKKKIEIKTPLILTFIIGITLLTGTLMMKDKQVFYSCPHINLCVNTILTPNKSPLNVHQ